jgi:hypothetical protein
LILLGEGDFPSARKIFNSQIAKKKGFSKESKEILKKI